MDGDGNAVLVRSHEDAGICVSDFDDAAREKLPGGFAIADADAVGKFGEFVDVLAGFGGHSELALAQAGFDVFGGVAGEGDFEIVDQSGAVHGDPGDETAFDQIDQDGSEADFNDVSTEAPENGLALFARAVDGAEQVAEILGGKDVGERIEKSCEQGVRGGRLGKIADADFALAG